MDIDDNAKQLHFYSSERRAKPFPVFCFLECMNENETLMRGMWLCNVRTDIQSGIPFPPEICPVAWGRSSDHSEDHGCTAYGCTA